MRPFRIAAVVLVTVSASVSLYSQQNSTAGELGVYQVRPNFYMLVGAGSNIGVQIGPDGVVLIDTGSTASSDRVLRAIKALTSQPIRYIIDTSADPDHVGGNEVLAKAGENFMSNPALFRGPREALTDSATIEATEEVLSRMTARDKTGKTAFPAGAWPNEAFAQREKPMYLNDEGIEVIREPAAHTDGDLIVFFRRSDVIMAGDVLDTTRFPEINVALGGSIQGEIDALNQLVKMAIPSIPLLWKPGGTNVVPGHGFLCDQGDIVEYRDMLVIIRDNVQQLIRQGKTLQQIQEANPTQGFRARYGSDSGPWTTDMFVEAVYRSLTGTKQK